MVCCPMAPSLCLNQWWLKGVLWDWTQRNFVRSTHFIWITCSLFNFWIYYHTPSIQWVKLYWTHWGRVTHICVSDITNIGSDNGLSPTRRQAIIWTTDGILLNEPLGTNFSEISIGIKIFSFKKMRFKMSSAKWRSICLGLNVLTATKHNKTWSQCIFLGIYYRISL